MRKAMPGVDMILRVRRQSVALSNLALQSTQVLEDVSKHLFYFRVYELLQREVFGFRIFSWTRK